MMIKLRLVWINDTALNIPYIQISTANISQTEVFNHTMGTTKPERQEKECVHKYLDTLQEALRSVLSGVFVQLSYALLSFASMFVWRTWYGGCVGPGSPVSYTQMSYRPDDCTSYLLLGYFGDDVAA